MRNLLFIVEGKSVLAAVEAAPFDAKAIDLDLEAAQAPVWPLAVRRAFGAGRVMLAVNGRTQSEACRVQQVVD
jgi:hypothetical protein